MKQLSFDYLKYAANRANMASIACGEEPDIYFDGADIIPERDNQRLMGQLETIRQLMKDSNWRSLRDIADVTGYPEASISANLRNMRKIRFGSHTVDRRHVKGGLYQYRVRE